MPACVYFALSRLAYVLGVGGMLLRQRDAQAFTRAHGVAAGYQRFRRIASFIMNNDGVAFVVLCLVTRGTFAAGAYGPALIAGGALLCVVGAGVKMWAAHSLGSLAYYWYDFFDPAAFRFPDPPGPYRWLDNPMYTVGYLPTFGLALLTRSWPGLAGALFAQVGILAFYHVVEKPHFRRLIAARQAA